MERMRGDNDNGQRIQIFTRRRTIGTRPDGGLIVALETLRRDPDDYGLGETKVMRQRIVTIH